MSRSFKVEIASPEHGWIHITLLCADQIFKISGSYLWVAPLQNCDTITELVNALHGVLDGRDTTVVHWFQEPGEYELVLTRTGERITLGIEDIKYSQHSGTVRKSIFTCSASQSEIVHAFWKALRDLETRQDLKVYETHWRNPFPVVEMKRLTERIRQWKAAVDE